MTLPFPLSGTTLIVGASNVGKTHTTARALDAWVAGGDDRATETVVFDFAPEVRRDGVLLGGDLTRFTERPESVWYGNLDADAPRTDGDDETEVVELARRNAAAAAELLSEAPADPGAVFVNDATIALQAGAGVLDALITYCDGAEVVVLNAFESEELGVDDPVSRTERAALGILRAWADRVVEL